MRGFLFSNLVFQAAQFFLPLLVTFVLLPLPKIASTTPLPAGTSIAAAIAATSTRSAALRMSSLGQESGNQGTHFFVPVKAVEQLVRENCTFTAFQIFVVRSCQVTKPPCGLSKQFEKDNDDKSCRRKGCKIGFHSV